MVKCERVEWVDICKGFAIILVVLGHSIRPEMMQNSILCSIIYNFIYSFHMALFMVLSGIVFRFQIKRNKVPFAQYIKKD